jgi:hypothetical protein
MKAGTPNPTITTAPMIKAVNRGTSRIEDRNGRILPRRRR